MKQPQNVPAKWHAYWAFGENGDLIKKRSEVLPQSAFHSLLFSIGAWL